MLALFIVYKRLLSTISAYWLLVSELTSYLTYRS